MAGYAQEMKTVGEPDEIRVPREDEETIEPAPGPDPAPTEPEPVPLR